MVKKIKHRLKFTMFRQIFKFSALLKIIFLLVDSSTTMAGNSDSYLSAPKIIKKNGYPAEMHIIQSPDGYLLEYHRIPHGKNMAAATKPYPVFLHHGLLSTSVDWIVQGPGKSLGYRLADEGYDVWMGNARGNSYSRSHATYSPDEKEFWNFTFHDMGANDLPAAIDYILEETKSPKLIYVGHSQGTSIFYVLAASRPEYNDKILFQVSIAPVGTITHTTSALKFYVRYAKLIDEMSSYIYKGAFMQDDPIMKYYMKFYCGIWIFNYNLCQRLILFKLFGKNEKQCDMNIISAVMQYSPSGTSTKNMVHSAQLVTSDIFRQYDYGSKENARVYGFKEPPQYDLSKITTPVKFYHGPNDLIALPVDVRYLYQQLPRPMGCKAVDYKQWNHIDFLYAKEMNKYFNDELVQFIKNATDSPAFVENLVAAELAARASTRSTMPKPTVQLFSDFKIQDNSVPQIHQIMFETNSIDMTYGNELV